MNSRLAWIGLALVLPSLITWLYFVAFAGRSGMAAVYGLGKLVQFLLPALCWWWWRARFDYRRLWSVRGLTVGVAFGLGVVAAIAALYPTLSAHEALVQRVRDQALPRLEAFGLASTAGYLVLAAFYSLAHSLLEEYYWRWFVYGELRRLWPSRSGATVLASVAFAAHHVIVLWVYFQSPLPTAFFAVCVAIGGAVWCWMYERFGSLLPIWASHLLVDAGIMAVGWLWLRPGLGA